MMDSHRESGAASLFEMCCFILHLLQRVSQKENISKRVPG
ncbi:rCG58776 [Rattus norvegicus]|uniref:RCG58776 n=1 Tax=Rattus norvegicus TaxID=10116 RepID=A6JL33_RAT|nr:rCG58776 [Rattus norvegicus]